MNIVTKVMKKMEYRRCLRKFEEALYYMSRTAESTSVHQGYANVATRNLNKALAIECKLNG